MTNIQRLYVDVVTQDGIKETITLRSSQEKLGVNIQANLKSLYQWDVELPRVLRVYKMDSQMIA